MSCSPAKGVDTTLDMCARLLDAGHDAVPHISARMVEGPEHTGTHRGVGRALPTERAVRRSPAMPRRPPVRTTERWRSSASCSVTGSAAKVGVTGYPDGHPLIPVERATGAPASPSKTLLHEAGVGGSISTQMCFDIPRILRWTEIVRGRRCRPPDPARDPRRGRPGPAPHARDTTRHRSIAALPPQEPGRGRPPDRARRLRPDRARRGRRRAGRRARDHGLHVFTFNAIPDSLEWGHGIVAPTLDHRSGEPGTAVG